MSYINWNGETNEQKLARKKREEIELFEQAAQIRSARSAQSANGAAGAGGQLTLPDLKTINGESILGVGDIPVQEVLNSGTNIKTVNGESILGSGNISAGLPGFVRTSGTSIWSTGTQYSPQDTTAYGYLTLSSASNGVFNTGFGSRAMTNVTTGAVNTGIGVIALNSLTTGYGNTAIGQSSLSGLTVGEGNTVVGHFSMHATTTGVNNVAVGSNSYVSGTNSSNNTMIGQGCSVYSNVGSNTWLGNNIMSLIVSTGTWATVENTIAIGAKARPTRNGQFVIGSADHPIEAVVSESLTPTKALKITVNGVDYKIPMQLA